jgi:hypothetical protein
MKNYIVKQSFTNLDGSFLRPGDQIRCDDARASRLRRFGKIGGAVDVTKKTVPETAVQNEGNRETGIKTVPETAVQNEGRKEKRDKRQQ